MQQQAIALYQAGAFAEAGALLARAIGEAPQDRLAWRYLALCFARQHQPDKALGLVELRQQHGDDALSLFYELLRDLCAAGRAAEFAALARQVPKDSLLGIIVEFFSGCLAARRDDAEAALAHLKSAAKAAAQVKPLFARDARLSSIEVQPHVFADFDDLARLEATPRAAVVQATPSLEPFIRFAAAGEAGGDAGFVYLCSCNEIYLERFGPIIAATLERAGVDAVLHLHVVDAGEATPGLIEALRRGSERLDIRWSDETFRHRLSGGYVSATYYACARFARAQEIAAHYGKDLLILDMDIGALGDVRRLAAAMRDAELGYFDGGGVLPWLICHGAAVYLRRSAAIDRYNELVFKYIADKIEHSYVWGLDQAAMWMVSRYLAARRPPFRCVEFAAALGTSLDAFLRQESTTVEKQKLRFASPGYRAAASHASSISTVQSG